MPALQVPGRLFASVYDRMSAKVEDDFGAAHRRALLASATGAVVELGAGTGVNLDHYPPSVQRLVLTEPDVHMRAKLAERAAGNARAVEVVDASADALPFEDASFDAAVATLVLCTVPDPATALREVLRVLRPGGRLLFIEHVRSKSPRTARVQDAVRPLWGVIGRGCHPNRDTGAAIAASGLEVERLDRVVVPHVPAFVHEAIVGSARKPGG